MNIVMVITLCYTKVHTILTIVYACVAQSPVIMMLLIIASWSLGAMLRCWSEVFLRHGSRIFGILQAQLPHYHSSWSFWPSLPLALQLRHLVMFHSTGRYNQTHLQLPQWRSCGQWTVFSAPVSRLNDNQFIWPTRNCPTSTRWRPIFWYCQWKGMNINNKATFTCACVEYVVSLLNVRFT